MSLLRNTRLHWPVLYVPTYHAFVPPAPPFRASPCHMTGPLQSTMEHKRVMARRLQSSTPPEFRTYLFGSITVYCSSLETCRDPDLLKTAAKSFQILKFGSNFSVFLLPINCNFEIFYTCTFYMCVVFVLLLCLFSFQ